MEPASFKTFHCDSHSQTLTTGLEKQWRENQFCDIAFEVEGKEFRCHKNVLAASSEYFTSVFTTGFKEKEKDLIILPSAFEIQPFQTLLDYFYSGKLVLSSENAEGVFVLSDYIRLIPVLEMATKYLEETLDGSNCIRRFIMTDTIEYKRPSVENLEKAAARLIIEDITKESATVDSVEFSREIVSKILTLGSQPENAEVMFQFVVKWVGYNEGNRGLFLRGLLKLISVSGLSFEFYDMHIKTEELLRRNPGGLEWLVDSVVPHLTNRMRIAPVVPHVTNPVCIVPTPQESLFVANWDGPCKCYELQIPNPTTLPISERPRMGSFSAVSHKKRIYLICGHGNKKTFMLEEGRSWVDSDVNLYFDRSSPGSVVIEDDLFVIGGWRNQPLNSCAKFNFATQKRLCIPDMKEKRDYPGVGVFENSIYASGGGSSTTERFDQREGQWRVVGSFNSFIDSCSSATVGNFLFICDIVNGRVTRFDFRTNRWEEVNSLWVGGGGGYWITTLNDQMYASQGKGSVLKYNKEGDNWSELCSGLDLICPIIVPWV